MSRWGIGEADLKGRPAKMKSQLLSTVAELGGRIWRHGKRVCWVRRRLEVEVEAVFC